MFDRFNVRLISWDKYATDALQEVGFVPMISLLVLKVVGCT